MTDIELKLRECLSDLSHAERVASKFLLDNFERFLNYTSDELAARSGASKATWTRFSKTMGYSGLKDLRRGVLISMQSFAADSKVYGESWLGSIKNDETAHGIAAKLADNATKAINDTVNIIDEEAYTEAAIAINKARSVRIFGTGASSVVASDLSQKLVRAGKNVVHFLDYHDSILAASTLRNDDLAIFISYSGKTLDINHIYNIAKKTGAPLLVMTKYGLNRPFDSADHKLIVSTPELEKRIGAFSSRLAQLFVVDVLYHLVLKYDPSGTELRLQKTYEISREFKDNT